jgi:hypothetical protein
MLIDRHTLFHGSITVAMPVKNHHKIVAERILSLLLLLVNIAIWVGFHTCHTPSITPPFMKIGSYCLNHHVVCCIGSYSIHISHQILVQIG